MTEKNQGAAEWLRRIIDQYEAKVGPLCGDMAELFGLCCDDFYTCPECRVKMMRAIADRIDAERALPEGVEWPRFEDGELVKVGDEVEFDGETWKVRCAILSGECWALNVECGYDLVTGRGDYGERVKRPKLRVLGADGAPIEVGDTVYCDGEDEPLTVTCINGVGGGYCSVTVKNTDLSHCTVDASRLTHERPDSWERLEEDAYHLVMSGYLETPEKDVSDIVRRAKALAKAGEEA